MKLEVGKYYKSYDKRKAYVVGPDATRKGLFVVEYITNDNTVNQFAVVDGTGSHIDNVDLDLVAEWKEEPELNFEWGPGMVR